MKFTQAELKEISVLIKLISGFLIEEKHFHRLRLKVLKRMDIVNAKTPIDYICILKQVNPSDEGSEITLLTASILNHHTSFFRDIDQYICLEYYCLPEIKTHYSILDYTNIKIWSAACSTGEEPYSISIILNSIIEPPWKFHINASDIDQPSLNIAQKGIYDENVAKHIPVKYLNQYFQKIHGGYKVKAKLKENISFVQLNLIEKKCVEQMKHYDVIFCNNVLFYFDDSTQNEIMLQLFSVLRPGGFIFFNGQASIASKTNLSLKKFGSAIVYQKDYSSLSKRNVTPVQLDSAFLDIFPQKKSLRLKKNERIVRLPITSIERIAKDRQLTAQDFIDIKETINRHSGLYLTKKDHDNLKTHIRFRMFEHKITDKAHYLKKLMCKDNEEEIQRLASLFVNHETAFFQDYNQLIIMAEKCLPIIQAKQKCNIPPHIETWCIGCSTGEEAYTLSIILNEILSETPDTTLHILATDMIQDVLDTASKGVYKKEFMQNVPDIYLKEHFTLLSNGYSLNLRIRQNITFECQNLMHQIKVPLVHYYDFIVCRNVLGMFDRKTQLSIFEALYQSLKRDGFLVIDSDLPFEIIPDKLHFFYFEDGIYQKKISGMV